MIFSSFMQNLSEIESDDFMWNANIWLWLVCSFNCVISVRCGCKLMKSDKWEKEICIEGCDLF